MRQQGCDSTAALKRNVLRMGVLVEEALRKSLSAIETEDYDLAAQVVRDDRQIDEMQAIIDDQCARVIVELNPNDVELRRVLTAIRIAAELERMGDHARHLSRRAGAVIDAAFHDVLPLIEEMTERVLSMVHDGLSAFLDDDAAAAIAVAERDDEIDRLHGTVYKIVVEAMKRSPSVIEKGIELIFVNRFLERLGDHVTNMCESVVFSQRAEHVQLND